MSITEIDQRRRRGPAALTGNDAWISRRTPTAKQGDLLPGRPTAGRGDRRGDARGSTRDLMGTRVRGLIVVLWRAGLRISEALGLSERDLDPGRGALLVRNGKGGKRREVGMDEWGWEQLRPWITHRARRPIGGALLRHQRAPLQDGRGRDLRHERSCDASRSTQASGAASLPISFATPMPSRWLGEGVPLNVIQRQLGHADLGVTSVSLQGIDNTEVITH